MKLLLLIDGKPKEMSIVNFEISYQKYEDTDIVIMISTPQPAEEAPKYEEFPPVQTPSSKGIVIQDLGPMPLISVAGEDLMIPLRKDYGITVVDPKTQKFSATLKSMGLESDKFVYNTPAAFKDAAESLFEREKKLVLTKYLVVDKEPYFEFVTPEEIVLKEVISVVSLIPEKEDATIVKSS